MGASLDKGESGNASFRIGTCSSPGVQESTFSRDHLRDSLELRLSDLASPLSPMVKELIPGDPTGEVHEDPSYLDDLDGSGETPRSVVLVGPAARVARGGDASGEF